MRVVQEIVGQSGISPEQIARLGAINPQLILTFWSAEPLADPAFYAELHAALPAVALVGCSTAGDIHARGVDEGGALLTAVHFDHATFHIAEIEFAGLADSHEAGRRLGAALPKPGLRGVLLFSLGVDVNGSTLIEGLAAELPASIPISGGLAGDNGAFQKTYVLGSSGPSSSKLVAVGLYGDKLEFGVGCRGGWTAFGPARKVTRALDSRLYELDGQPALALYKKYLGDYARDLPAAGLLFPFEMLDDERNSIGLLRTILGIDEDTQSLLLAGSVQEGAYLRLMHAGTDDLVDGAESAAAAGIAGIRGQSGLALLVSCVGRKLVMGDRVDEEVMAVGEQLGAGFTLAGFYSNGEVSPLNDLLDCKLHNQTMTIALLSES